MKSLMVTFCLRTAAAVVTMVVLLVNDPAASTGASFQGLGWLPAKPPWSHGYGVSGDGQVVVGSSETGASFVSEAFRCTEATGMVGLGYLPGGDNSLALDTSADGSVVVGWARSPRGQEAFRWTAATGMVGLGDLRSSDFWSTGFGVSADGSVVAGEAHSRSGPEAFRWTQATGMVGLGDLPGGSFHSFATDVSADGSVVVGFSNSASGQEAFRWTSQARMVGLGDLPGGSFFSQADGVSPDGSVVVGFGSSAAGYEAFRWTQATGMVGLGDLPGGSFDSAARAVSADGSVVVGEANYSPSFGETTAFIWDAAHGMRSLRDVLVNEYGLGAALAGWTLDTAEDISPDGKTTVGVGINPDRRYEAWVAFVPEPSTVTFLTLGGLCLLTYAWRKHRH